MINENAHPALAVYLRLIAEAEEDDLERAVCRARLQHRVERLSLELKGRIEQRSHIEATSQRLGCASPMSAPMSSGLNLL